MRRKYWLAAVTAALPVAAVAVVVVTQLEQRRDERRFAVLERYCTECHNPAELAGELSFEGLTLDEVPQHAEQFEAAIVKLRGRLMPPPGEPQPSPKRSTASSRAWKNRSTSTPPHKPATSPRSV